MTKTFFLTASSNNGTITIPWKGRILSIFASLSLGGAVTSVVSIQFSLQGTSVLAIDPSGAQFSDSVFGIVNARSNATGNSPVVAVQQFIYRIPVVIQRQFYIHWINTLGDTFDIGITMELAQ